MTKKIEDSTEYVKQTAKLMGLKLTPEYLPGVVDNFNTLATISTLISEFELTENIEIAPTFKPSNNK